MISCPICSSSSTSIKYTGLYDDRYGFDGQYNLVRCQSCRHLFIDARFSPEELTALYTDYYPRKQFDVKKYKPHVEARGFKAWLDGSQRSAFRWVPRNVCVLDIGCGFGEALGYHKARGCEVYGIEADENIRRVADRYGFNVTVGIFSPSMYHPEYFDFVTMDQVIEHVTDPVSVFRGIAQILKPGGTAILSTPNPYGYGAYVFWKKWINWHVPYHLHFFSSRSIAHCAKLAGLTVESQRTITSSEWLHYQWLHLLTYPAKGSKSTFWGRGMKVGGFDKWLVRAAIVLNRMKVDHALTRLADSLGVGDNRLVILRKPLQP